MAEGGAYLVCVKCLEDNPKNFDHLIQSQQCFLHQNARKVNVWQWEKEGILEIYPSVSQKPAVRSSPMFLKFPGNFKLCRNVSRPNGCYSGEKCNHAHSVEEMEKWNAIKVASESRTSETKPGHMQSPKHWESPKHFHQYQGSSTFRKHFSVTESPILSAQSYEPTPQKHAKKKLSNEETSILSLALSQSNYQEKLRILLNLEELAHVEELRTRCDGEYQLLLDGNTPFHKSIGLRNNFNTQVHLTGLNGDQISYATQASRIVTITTAHNIVIQASILPRNYNHTEEKLYLGSNEHRKIFSLLKNRQQSIKVNVKFELKHEYFDRLRDSVARVSPEVVSRIVPDGFLCLDGPSKRPVNLENFMTDLPLRLCSEDQLDALKEMPIDSCSKGEPPFLLTGPFGSGKTRLLALAAHISFRSFQKPMHLLVCVQQHVSAGAFLSCFNDLATARDVFVIQVVTENKYHSSDNQYNYLKTVNQLQEIVEKGIMERKKKVMIIATCSTANNLLYKKVFRCGYFSHIYIDEGAQMREPEAVAPLGFATEETILVMAGDQHQVGPAMLVLGEKPQTCGLSVSLVERLHTVYTKDNPDEGDKHHRALTTNFRCHPGIMKLSGDLFYKTNLTCQVKPHEDAPYPFHFVCSEVDDVLRPLNQHTSYDKEAEIVAKKIVKFSTPGLFFPLDGTKPDVSQFAYASPCRSQLSTIERFVKIHEKLRNVKKVPIYDIQGNEYRALFLSTTEPTNQDGSTLNPTKSICDPFVFNTVISRAQSVIVSVGNPFLLLRKESHMVAKYGDKARCWSNYLKLCLENRTITAAPSLKLTEEEWEWKLSSIRALVNQSTTPSKANVVFAEPASKKEATGESSSRILFESPLSGSGSQESPVSVSPVNPATSQESDGALDHEAVSLKSSVRKHSNPTEEAKFIQEFKITTRLGKGGYGVVYGVQKKFDEADYAVKIIKLNPQSKRDIKREVKALATLNHPRIVRYYSAWTETLPEDWQTHKLWADLKNSETYTQREMENKENFEAAKVVHPQMSILREQKSTDDSFEISFRDDTTRKSTSMETNRTTVPSTEPKRKPSAVPVEPTCLFIQTELCERGTLRDWLTDNTTKRSRERVLLFSKQILEAVKYIHSKKLIHRDLKPSNILFERDVSNSLKVGDFGLVIPWERPALPTKAALSPKSVSRTGGKARSHTTNAGTRLYQSPEQQAQQHYNSKVDIFALGLILFELNYPMVTGHEMNKVFNDLRTKGKEGFPPDFVENLPNEARLIGTMVNPKPEERPTAEQILKGGDLRSIEDDINLKKLIMVPFSN